MKTVNIKKILGNGLNYLVALALIVSGILKLVGFQPYQEMINELGDHYFENIYLLGGIAILSGVLFAIPRTFAIGCMATLVFLGGTISAHMQHGDNYAPQLVFVLLTVVSAYLKRKDWFEQKAS